MVMLISLVLVILHASFVFSFDNFSIQSKDGSSKHVDYLSHRKIHESSSDFNSETDCQDDPISIGSAVDFCHSSPDEIVIFGTGGTSAYTETTKSPFFNLPVKTIRILEGVTSIGAYLFFTSHAETIEISSTVKTIGTLAFKNCFNLLAYQVDPNNPSFSSDSDGVLLSKSQAIFRNYPIGKPDTSYVIPSTVTTLSTYAFEYALNLKRIEIGSKVPQTINVLVFANLYNLEEITVNGNTKLTSIDGVLYKVGTTLTLIKYPSGKQDESFSIPATVTAVNANSFDNCSHLQSINVGKDVTSIVNTAIVNCQKLKSFTVDSENIQFKSVDDVLFTFDMTQIVKYPSGKIDEFYSIPSDVTTINLYAFNTCNYLKTVTAGDNLITINANAFANCENLETVTVGNQLITIAASAFANCVSLRSLTVESNKVDGPKVTNTGLIGASAFSNCPKLQTVHINQLKTIAKSAFSNCPELTKVKYLGEIGPTCTQSAFENCPELTYIAITTSYQGDLFCELPASLEPTPEPTPEIVITSEISSENDPAETLNENDPAETLSENDPVETLSENDPAETLNESESTETLNESESVETLNEGDTTEIESSSDSSTINQPENEQPSGESNNKSSKRTAIIAGTVVGGVALLTIITLAIIVIYKRRLKANQYSNCPQTENYQNSEIV